MFLHTYFYTHHFQCASFALFCSCHYEPEYAYTFVTHKLLRDYGFVEQYPQRWNLFGGELRFGLHEKLPNVLEPNSNELLPDLEITWYDGAPTYETIEDEDYITRFYGHLKALKSIPVHEIVQEHNLPSNEANTIIAFHDALVIMVKHLIWYFEDKSYENENADSADVGGTASSPVTYGVGNVPLLAYTDPLGLNDQSDDEYNIPFNTNMCSRDYTDQFIMMSTNTKENSKQYERIGTHTTYHQSMTFWQNKQDGDKCFKIESNLESCERNRPHYHESFVHYPATWVRI